MIVEIAHLTIKPGTEVEFEAAVFKASAAFGRAKGFHGFKLNKSIEKPLYYQLIVKWETLDNHMVDFRNSIDFAEWRSLAGPFFAEPPTVEHTQTVVVSA